MQPDAEVRNDVEKIWRFDGYDVAQFCQKYVEQNYDFEKQDNT